MKTLESWRKAALERERERARWASSPYTTRESHREPYTPIERADAERGDPLLRSSSRTSKSDILAASAAGNHVGAQGGPRTNEYYFVARSVRDSIRSRVRKELGQGIVFDGTHIHTFTDAHKHAHRAREKESRARVRARERERKERARTRTHTHHDVCTIANVTAREN